MSPQAPPWWASGQPARFGPAVLARRHDEAVARDAREAAALAPVAEAREAVPAAAQPRVSTLARAAAAVAEEPLTAVGVGWLCGDAIGKGGCGVGCI